MAETNEYVKMKQADLEELIAVVRAAVHGTKTHDPISGDPVCTVCDVRDAGDGILHTTYCAIAPAESLLAKMAVSDG